MTKPIDFRSWALSVLVILVLGACNRDWDAGRASPVGARSAATVMAPDDMGTPVAVGVQELQPRAAGARVPFAALPDRGDLVGYPQEPVVRRDGAYTWHRANVSEEHALRAIFDGELRITAPDGQLLAFEYERHVEHPTGDWTWVGRLHDAPPGRQAILTFGADAVFGAIAQSGAAPLRLAMRDGASWLVETDLAQLAGVEARVLRADSPDFLLPPVNMGSLSGPRASGDTVSSSGSSVESSSSTSSSATTVVDVLVGYTSGFATAQGGDSQARTRINFLIELGNQAYLNSQIDARLRLVHAMQVNYPDATENGDTLEKLTGYKSGEGDTTPDPAFNALRNARETYGADLVTLVRKFSDPENDGCGIAWLIGGGLTTIHSGYERFGYSVVSDGTDQGEDGKNYFCRNETMVHEFGHNMGSAHDVETAKGDDGVLDNPDDYGRYTYSFGYRTGPGAGDFYTIMAYREQRESGTQQQAYTVFSNPNITYCGGFACGTSNADNARSLRNTIGVIAGFRGTKVTDPTPAGEPGVLLRHVDVNGDGKSDLLFFNHAVNKLAWWFMNGAQRIAYASVALDGQYRLVDTGDFNHDRRTDLLFTRGNDVLLGISNGVGYDFHLLPYTYKAPYKLLALVDVNGDYKSDILLHDESTGRIVVWYMDGATRTAYNVATVPASLKFIGHGNVNRDRFGDLLWVDSGRNLHVSLGIALAFDTIPIGLAHSAGYTVAGFQDINGDYKSDILLYSASQNRLVVWYMDGTSRTAYNAHATLSGYDLVGKGNFNGDRLGDLLWRNSSGAMVLAVSTGSAFGWWTVDHVPGAGWLVMDVAY